MIKAPRNVQLGAVLLGGASCLAPVITSPVALLLGAVIALALGNPEEEKTKRFSKLFLSIAVAGLGAGMDLAEVARVGLAGIGYTFIGLSLTLAAGYALARLFRTERDTGLLISVGTAVCGGSAIAAVAPAIDAKNHSISVALGTVFILNAVALFFFPFAGHAMGLTEHQFGLWAALAIHDTSSVVGATLQYGPEALQTGTTMKLARALWILPLSLLFGYIFAGRGKRKFPWFIAGFIATAAIFSAFPQIRFIGEIIAAFSKRLLVVTLFLIGLGLTRDVVKSAGASAFALGLALWVLAALGSLWAVKVGLVH
ncbi:MAG TPA: putative sulfate exporter family transporter [Patescibacteria group bacterium]|nr:putative sulfate exporter family transporter [Patescibacteria group bacterium]